MPIDLPMNVRSILDLVASDFAYKSGTQKGELLRTFPDSESAYEASFPTSLALNLRQEPLTQFNDFQQNGVRGIELPQWKVAHVIEDSGDGFGAVVLKSTIRGSDGKFDYIVAFRGTDGLDGQDWFANLDLAATVWDNHSIALIDYLTSFQDDDDKPSLNRIHFTGQSLGGGLAQYAAYDYALAVRSSNPAFRQDMTLTTFNSFGGVRGLQQLAGQKGRPSQYDPNILANVVTAHYSIENDIVHRLGAGAGQVADVGGSWHVNGADNTYQFRFRRYDNDVPVAGPQNFLGIVEGHRIESGFYRGFQNNPINFLKAEPEKIAYIDGETSLSLAAAWSRVGNKGFTTELSAWTRVALGGAAIAIAGDVREIKQAASVLAEALYKSGDTPAGIGATKAGILALVGVIRIHNTGAIAGKIAGTVFAWYLERRAGLQPEEKKAATQALNSFLPVNRQLAESDVVGNANESNATRNFRADLASIIALSFAETETEISQYLINPRYADLARALHGIAQKDQNRLEDALAGTNWLADTVAELRSEAIESFASDADKEKKFANFSVQVAGLINDVKLATAQQDVTFLSSVGTTLQNFIREAAGILSSLPIDVISQSQAAQPEIGTNTLTFQRFDEIRDVFAEAAQSAANAGIERAIDGALKTIESAGQTIVIAQGRPQNPFDEETFDPDASPVAIGAILEGEVKAFTVFLPYEAQEGGQHASLALGGAAAGKFVVLLDAAPIELSDNGEFDLLIDEGSRSISFGLWAQEDVDADETLSLSATLVDAEGNSTHLTHLELNLALDATDEALPIGGREIRGDWAAKPYINPVTGETFPYSLDDLGNIVRDPGVPNTGEWGELDNKLDGSPGPDHIVTGDYEDTAYGFEGDDSITGSEVWGSIFYGGAGNDWIEALSYTEHTADYFEFEYLGRTIKLGEDKIYGGAGDDRIYGESEATLAALYDSATLPTGLPGDWSSGGSGADHIYGGAGDDVLMGGIGEDLLVGGAGQDVLLGDDAYLLRPGGNFWRVLHPNFGDATPGFSGFELGLFPVVNVTQSFPDMVFRQTGDPEFTYYKNGGADDVLIGGAGKDILIGQYGDDKLYGGDDNDILAGWEGADELFGGEGDDLMAGDFGRYEQPNQRVVAAPNVAPAGARNPANSDGSVVDQSGNDFLDGGSGNDTLFGEGGDDILLGGAGNDTLYGDAAYLPEELHGNDTLDGGAGNDLLYGNAGNDKLYGGSGDDTLDGGAGNDLLDGGAGNDSLAGGEGDDALDGGDGSDTLAGGAGNDVLRSGVGNDQLDGGDGDDVLLAGEGENWLVGGDGNDALYGGSLGDFLSGGAGNDLLDAGAGIDFVYGEEGNDTYVLDFGYGRDFFEDAEGANRIEFSAGIAQEQITAEWTGSALTVAYGFGEDAFTVDLAQFQLDGINFADGTGWTKKNLVNIAPRVLTAGSEAGDTVEGVLYGRNDLQGLGGNDRITGAGHDDLLAGGEGADTLDGAGGSDRYFFTADESGIDRISDSELAGRAYLDWFYENLGIADWEGRATHGGTFEVSVAGDGEVLTIYYGTYEEAFADYPEATITFIEPLPEAAPLITRNDTDALDQLVNAGVLARDVVEFGPGLTLADLNITINVNGTVADQHPEQPWYGGGTLAVRWGNAGFDLQVPDVNYGFVGSNLLSDGIDSSYDDPAGSWRGYRLGEGVEAFEFADGGTYSLEEILQQATVVARYGYEFLRGSGYQVIDRSQDSVYFGAGIQASEIQVSSNGADLLITLNDGSAQGRIVDWYADPAAVPSITLRFADGTELDTDSITRLGLTRYGTEDSDFLQANSDFSHALYGLGGPDTLVGQGGNDLLDGGSGDDYLQGDAGNDTYIFGRGYGQDVFEEYDETAGNIDTLRFGADIAPSDVVVSGDVVGRGDDGNLILSIDGTDDQVVLQYWFWDEESKIEQVVFADGTVWDVAALESMVPMAEATEDADLIFGTSADDIIDGLGGDDEIAGSRSNDILGGGEGDDYLVGNGGNDILLGGEGADYLEDWNGNNYFDAGGGDDSVYAEFSANFVLGGTGNDEVDNYASGSVIAFNAGDGQDTIYAAAALTLSLGGGIHAADLSISRDGTDFVLEISAVDSIRLTRQWEDDPEVWPQLTLQIIDGAVTTYDLNEIINQYNSLQSNDPSLTSWQIGNALASVQLDSSTEFALGGDLAYRYASTGSNDGLAPDVIRGIVSDPSFGVDAQPFEGAAPALTGTTGNDTLTGSTGPDTLIGGAGDDTLAGGAGNDTYVFDSGSGVDIIQDSAGVDTISFGAGITPGMLTLGLGSLLIKVGDGGDAIHIEGFDPDDVYGSAVIENFAFSDNTVLAYNDLLARGFDLAGTESDDVITGTNVADRINGLGGSDTLSGGDGDDTLDGGAGSDVLNGGAGSDTYFFGRGSGSDSIEDPSGSLDKIVLDDTITPGDLTVTRTDDVLTIHIDDIGDELAIRWQPQSGFQIEQVQFADGTTWDAAMLEAQVNHAPLIGAPLSAPDATEDASFAFTLPSDAFFDPDANDALTFRATLADGTVLPTWLAFDGATFSGTPANGDVGSVEIKVTATDHRGLSVADAFMLNVANVNDAPTLVNVIADQDTPEDAAFSFVVPADSFADVDAGDVLSYGATLVDGSPLPAWLSFDAAQLAFSGTPANGDVGTLHVRVTATDQSGANASNDFTLTVNNTNDAPEVASAIADQRTLEDAPFSFALPANAFSDVDMGDALTFSATLFDSSPLPAWLRFDPATHAFTGTPGNGEVGTWGIAVTATDTADASVADTFDITVVNVNDAPELINSIVKQWIADGDAMQFQLPGNTFTDIDIEDSLSYSATAGGAPLPAWLAFDALTRTFSGTPDEADIGTLSLAVTATDTRGATASDSFDLEVTVAPDKTLIGTGSDDLLAGRSGNDTLAGLAGNDALSGRSGNDRLTGGADNDLLDGGTGDDTYVYQAGDGLDTIADLFGNDTVAFGAGLTRDNVVARMSADNTTARIRVLDANGNEQTNQGFDVPLDAGGNSPIEWFAFANGDSAGLGDLLIGQEVHYGTRRNDVIRTGRNDDTIYGDFGNDTVYAGTGNDVLFGGRGRDILYGEAGNDVLVGDRGKDRLYGGYGDDVLDGGRGSDILDGGAGFNIYVFERNFGDDRIVSGGGTGVLRFGAGITERDLSFKRRNDDLVVKVKGEGHIRIEGWFDANAAHQVAGAEFADGTILTAGQFVAKGYDYEPERDEDDDEDNDVSHYGGGDSTGQHGATHNDDHPEGDKKTSPDRGKKRDRSDNEWFEKVVEKWDARSSRSAQSNAEKDDARSNTSRGTQRGNRWQSMHDRLSAHLADGHDDDGNGGADLTSLKPGSAHGPAFTQFSSIGYGGVGVRDSGAADLRPFTGLREGLERIA